MLEEDRRAIKVLRRMGHEHSARRLAIAREWHLRRIGRLRALFDPWPMTVELWRRSDGKRLLEVSIKTPVVQAAAAIGGFMAFLAEVGAERDEHVVLRDRGQRAVRRRT